MKDHRPNPDRLVEQARHYLLQDELTTAEHLCRDALSLVANHIGARATLGQVLHAQKQYGEAERAFIELTDLQPREAMFWMNVGTARRCAGRIDEALFAFAKAAALGAANADFYYNVALAHIDRNDYESARALLSKALALSPGDTEIRYRYAWCCYECLHTEEAVHVLSDWNSEGSGGDVNAKVGHLLMKLGDVDRGESIVRKATMENANDIRARLTLAQMLERTNRLAEASVIVDDLYADTNSREVDSELLLLRAQLAQRQSRHELAAELFSDALAQCRESHNAHFVQFPLAKSLDAMGRFEDAFRTLTDAHTSQSEYLRLTAPAMVLRGAPAFGIADYPCDPVDVGSWLHRSAPDANDSPVFIVGFPRSGTTLLELALDAHPHLKSIDEQPFLQNSLDDVLDLGVRYPSQLAQLTDEHLIGVRSRYWDRVSSKIELRNGQRLVDKNPLNLLRLPLIVRLFPNAHILLAIRHPCDVLLSCFMQHFRAPDFALLCQNLPTLADGYRKAFDFWYEEMALLEPNCYEIRYESFVSDFDAQIRAVIEFLGIPWHDAVLEPGARALEKKFISTPSYSQVVQSVSPRAVNRWRNYELHFAPVLPELKSYFDRWGYDCSLTTAVGMSNSK